MADIEKMRQTLTFFRSVIKCGEPWTQACEDAYQAALRPPSPEQDEREALLKIIDHYVMQTGLNGYIADAILAAGWRRER